MSCCGGVAVAVRHACRGTDGERDCHTEVERLRTGRFAAHLSEALGDVPPGQCHVFYGKGHGDECEHESAPRFGHATNEGFHRVVRCLHVSAVAVKDCTGTN